MRLLNLKNEISSLSVVRGDDNVDYFYSSDVPDMRLIATDRFWKSLWKNLKVADGLFDIFTSEEIFSKVATIHGRQRYKFVIEALSQEEGRLLGITPVMKRTLSVEQIRENLPSSIKSSSYEYGMIYAVQDISEYGYLFKMDLLPNGEDVLALRTFNIDGFGPGYLYPGVKIGDRNLFFITNRLRTLDEATSRGHNSLLGGLTARSRNAFGERMGLSIMDAMFRRINSATTSAASLSEIAKFYDKLVGFDMDLAAYDDLLSNPFDLYGIPSHKSLSKSRMTSLPAKATVYDLFIAISAAVQACQTQSRKFEFYKLAGELISTPFDFDGLSIEDVIANLENTPTPEAEAPKTKAVKPKTSKPKTTKSKKK